MQCDPPKDASGGAGGPHVWERCPLKQHPPRDPCVHPKREFVSVMGSFRLAKSGTG